MTTSPDWALLDTNILVYADQSEDEHHAAAKALRDQDLYLQYQALYPFL